MSVNFKTITRNLCNQYHTYYIYNIFYIEGELGRQETGDIQFSAPKPLVNDT